MSYVLDTTHSKKNIAVYSENRETDKDYFLSLEGKWRKILKNGKSGWLVPLEFTKKLEKFVKSKAPSAPSSSPLTTIKQNGKNRKTQEKYRRAVSEDEGVEEDKKAPPPTENQAEAGEEDGGEEDGGEEEAGEEDGAEEATDNESESPSEQESEDGEFQSTEEEPETTPPPPPPPPTKPKRENLQRTQTTKPENISRGAVSTSLPSATLSNVKDVKDVKENRLQKNQRPPSAPQNPVKNTQGGSPKTFDSDDDEVLDKKTLMKMERDRRRELIRRDQGRREDRRPPRLPSAEKYEKYKTLAKRKPVVLSDTSTDQSDDSSDDFPSPSPVRRDEYSTIVRKMRELERQLKKK